MTEEQQDLSETILQVTREKRPETVSQLARLVRESHPASEQEILGRITRLQNDGRLRLTPKPPYRQLSLSAYLQTFDAAWYWTTLALTLAGIAAIFTIPADWQPYVLVRYVLAMIFILWLPGYTLIRALFPPTPPAIQATSLTRTVQNLDTIERIALSIGLSLALVPIIGLLLNYTPWGITLTPIALSLAGMTLAFATAAVLRENQQRRAQAKPKA